MTNTAKTIKAIFIKDVVSEFRSKEVLPTMIVLGMLIVWVLRIAFETSNAEMNIVASAALWIAFLFAGLLTQEHSFQVETHQDCMNGLLLAPVDPGAIYIAKLMVNVFMITLFELIIVPVVIFIFDLNIAEHLGTLALVLLLGNLAISGVGTLFSAMVQVSKVQGSLLSILVLIILMPVMVPASFGLLYCFGAISEEQIGTGALSLVGSFKSAISFIAVFDSIFITAGWLLFGFVVQE